jgi:WD40 repeat protein
VITSLAFSPDGTLLGSGDGYWDFAIRLWDTASLQQVRLLEGNTHAVVSLVFSPNGQMLASGSYNGDVRLWGVRP